MTKKRGRPRGTGKNDTPYLAQVAEFMVVDPKLKPTTAMKRVIATRRNWGATDDTLLRRWQDKWKNVGADLLSAAKERAASKPIRSSGYRSSPGYGTVTETATMMLMRAIDDTPMMKAMRAIEESTTMKLMREMQRIEDLIDPPWQRKMREQERLERTMRDLIDPPYLRAARGMF